MLTKDYQNLMKQIQNHETNQWFKTLSQFNLDNLYNELREAHTKHSILGCLFQYCPSLETLNQFLNLLSPLSSDKLFFLMKNTQSTTGWNILYLAARYQSDEIWLILSEKILNQLTPDQCYELITSPLPPPFDSTWPMLKIMTLKQSIEGCHFFCDTLFCRLYELGNEIYHLWENSLLPHTENQRCLINAIYILLHILCHIEKQNFTDENYKKAVLFLQSNSELILKYCTENRRLLSIVLHFRSLASENFLTKTQVTHLEQIRNTATTSLLYENTPLTLKLLHKAFTDFHHAAIETQSSVQQAYRFHESNQRHPLLQWRRKINKLLINLSTTNHPNEQLSDPALNTLTILIDDFEKNTKVHSQKTLIAFEQFKELLYKTNSLQALLPKPKQDDLINKNEYPKHLKKINDIFNQCELADHLATRVLKFFDFITNSRTTILKFFNTSYPDLYYNTQFNDVPLHIDNVSQGDQAAFEQYLDQLTGHFIGAFYKAQEKGKTIEFFNQLYFGHCIESRSRALFDWVDTLSGPALLTFDEFMQKAIKAFLDYSLVMEAIDNTNASYLEPTLKFICEYYDQLDCIPNPDFAPKGKITEEGIKRYLSEVLAFPSIS